VVAMVQARSTAKPAASRRNAPPGGGTQPPEMEKTTRVKNAKELRTAYVELQQAPDGVDLEPMTMPKCVECSHCGWPVYPRESKVATKKTFARAGIIRGSRKEEEEKRKANAGTGEAEEDAGSEDSRDTVERLSDDIEDLKDRVEELENENRELKDQVDDLTKELEATKAALAEANERIEFLEEAELRWREKLSQARMEIERLKQAYERASTVSADRECGLIKTLIELRELREKHEAFVRRRNLMLIQLEQRLENKENEDHKAAATRLWRTRAATDNLRRQKQDLELKRQREVRELGTQLHAEKEHVSVLKSAKEKLTKKLKEAGQRLLRRALGEDAWPSALDHAFRSLVAMHPVNCLENSLEFCQSELDRTTQELEQKTEECEAVTEERDDLLKLKGQLETENKDIHLELDILREKCGSDEDIERRKREQEEKERAHIREIESWVQKVADMEVETAEQIEGLDTQIKVLEQRLALAEAPSKASGGTGEAADDEASRVAPKGQGVLCVCCLKQLVHRTVRPLPPKEAMKGGSNKIDKARRQFFEQELQGLADPSDELHSFTFNQRKDPYGITRLTLHPGSAITKPTSPSSPNLHSPTTGLPALKKRTVMGGSATSLRSSMKEFRPRNFR